VSVALVTGCSSGIGLATAVEFARQGARVVATMRNLDRVDPLRVTLDQAGLTADLRVLDVADDDSVQTTIASVLADYERIDVVVSNAGIGIDGTTEELSIDDFRASFETNSLGSVRLLHAVLPGWRARGAGRFVAIGSMAGVVGNPFNDAYCASKFALEGLLESLYPVAAHYGVSISIVQPGPVAGDFAGKYGSGSARVDGNPYAEARARFQIVQDAGYANAQTAQEIAEIVWRVANAEAPVLRYQTSDMVSRVVGLKLKDLTGERVTGMTQGWI
jgi:NAD(P)-dependent dehydrogenase (short-subunit alcohol dehydrogenase family)